MLLARDLTPLAREHAASWQRCLKAVTYPAWSYQRFGKHSQELQQIPYPAANATNNASYWLGTSLHWLEGRLRHGSDA